MAGGTQYTKYYLLHGERVALREGSDPAVYLYHDALGSTRATSVSDAEQYYPYGGTRVGGVTSTPYRYTGQRAEPTGLYFYGARWYDPALGRFLQPDTIVPDPANPQSLNRYSYTLNNPLKYTDPTGHCVTPMGVPIPGCFELLGRIGQLIVQYAPELGQAAQAVQQWADKLPVLQITLCSSRKMHRVEAAATWMVATLRMQAGRTRMTRNDRFGT